MPTYTESYAAKIHRKVLRKQHIVAVACGKEPADLILKNATYLNVFSNELCTGDIAIADGLFVGMGSYDGPNQIDMTGKVITPGFIDAHIHLESSLVSPMEFAKAVLPHGTTTVITDPHEIANVMGTDGIEFMLEATEGLPVDVHFMLPSCVPASPVDEAGANLDYRAIDSFYNHPRVLGLAEMMNYIGVMNGDRTCLEKIAGSQSHHKKIDGHAPGLKGNELNAYIAAGVYSDHECSDVEEALEKLRKGQFIMIRDGTAAHNLADLIPLLVPKYYSRCMFATDDKHPNDLLEIGHMDYLISYAIKAGVDPIIAVKTGSHNAARYFLLNNKGAIAPGYLADFVVLDDLQHFNIEKVYKRGVLRYADGEVMPFEEPKIDEFLKAKAKNTFHMVGRLTADDFMNKRPRGVIGMVPGEITSTDEGYADHVDLEKDILKICVVERHNSTGHIGIGYIKGYGLKQGAVATSFSHDSHNIIAVGVTDEDIAAAVNRIVDIHGGITVVKDCEPVAEVVLDIAGLMCERPLRDVNDELEKAKLEAHKLGVSYGIDPFMTLSFMSLPVIPELRLTTRGIIDVVTQQYL